MSDEPAPAATPSAAETQAPSAPPAQQDTTPAAAPANPSVPAAPNTPNADSAPHRSAAFLRLVQAWANGDNVPDNATIKGCLEDLRGCLGERAQLQQQVQQLEGTLREQQAQLFASQGREDALLRVCFRAQAT